MDEIIALDKENGSIAERGTFQQLMERNGLFADMARKQGIFAAPKAQG
jgi:ABC-type multidrug transport system fused ATPase/permease subunit